MLYCDNCGKRIEKEDKYCTNCGQKIDKNINFKAKKQKKYLQNDQTKLWILLGILIVILVFTLSLFIGKKLVTYINNTNSSNISSNNQLNNNDNYYGNGGNNGNYYYNNGGSTSEQEPEQSNSSFTNISIDEFLELKDKSESSIVFIGRNSSSYCIQEAMNLYIVASHYGVNIYYLDISNISNEDYTKLQEVDSYFNGNWGIPLVVIVKEGKVVDKLTGLQSSNQLLNFFQQNELL